MEKGLRVIVYLHASFLKFFPIQLSVHVRAYPRAPEEQLLRQRGHQVHIG